MSRSYGFNSPPKLGGVAATSRNFAKHQGERTGWLSNSNKKFCLNLINHTVCAEVPSQHFLTGAATLPNLGGELGCPHAA